MDGFGPAKVRKCLKCDQDFRSEGPANRLCPKCNIENAKMCPPRYEILLQENTGPGGVSKGKGL